MLLRALSVAALVVALLLSVTPAAAGGPALNHLPRRVVDSGGRVLGSTLLVSAVLRREHDVFVTLDTALADGIHPGYATFMHEAADCADARLLEESGLGFIRPAIATTDTVPVTGLATVAYYAGNPVTSRPIRALEGNTTLAQFQDPSCVPTVGPYCCLPLAVGDRSVGLALSIDLSVYTPPFTVK